MYELIRTENAGMKLSEAIELNDNLKKEDISKHIIKPQDVIPLEKVDLNEEEYKYVLNGNKFKNMHNAKKDILLLKDNTVVALAVADEEFIQPKKVLL
jgi:tRNA U55 pseudouridine synthase TruB